MDLTIPIQTDLVNSSTTPENLPLLSLGQKLKNRFSKDQTLSERFQNTPKFESVCSFCCIEAVCIQYRLTSLKRLHWPKEKCCRCSVGKSAGRPQVVQTDSKCGLDTICTHLTTLCMHRSLCWRETEKPGWFISRHTESPSKLGWHFYLFLETIKWVQVTLELSWNGHAKILSEKWLPQIPIMTKMNGKVTYFSPFLRNVFSFTLPSGTFLGPFPQKEHFHSVSACRNFISFLSPHFTGNVHLWQSVVDLLKCSDQFSDKKNPTFLTSLWRAKRKRLSLWRTKWKKNTLNCECVL